jgi:hypothetical protein
MVYNTFVRAEGIINQDSMAIDSDLHVITPIQLLQAASAAAFCFKVRQSVLCINKQVRQSVQYFWKLLHMHYLTQHAAKRLTKGKARFFTLAVGDKVLLKSNFCMSNVFAKDDWTPPRKHFRRFCCRFSAG